MSDFSLTLAGEPMALLPERALWWPGGRTLFAADTHWGKAGTFRARGLPVPDNTADDLARLSNALRRCDAARLVILGDLVHARAGRDAPSLNDLVTGWRREHAGLDVLLVEGNHDRAARPPAAWKIAVVREPFAMEPFVLRHIPDRDPRGHVLAGHTHPAVRLVGGGERLKLPCFQVSEETTILPAFGSFIDGLAVVRQPGKRLYAVADGEIFAI